MSISQADTDVLRIVVVAPDATLPDAALPDAAAQARLAAAAGLTLQWQGVTSAALLAGDLALPQGRMVLVYPGLVARLEAALADGTPPDAALAGWRRLMEAVLQLYRRRRMTTFLAEAATLTEAPALLAARLAAWAGGPAADAPATETPETAAPASETRRLAGLMAATALLAARDLRRLGDELAAGGLAQRPAPLEAAAPMQAMAGLWSRLGSAAAETTRLQAEIGTLAQRPPVVAPVATPVADPRLPELEQQILALQEMLEQEFRNQAALRTRLAAQPPADSRSADEIAAERRRIEELERDLQTLRTSLADRDSRTMALTRDLQAREAAHDAALAILQAERQTERAASRNELAQRDQALAAQRVEVELMQAEIQRIYRSTSWRISAPVRAVRRGLDRLRGRRG